MLNLFSQRNKSHAFRSHVFRSLITLVVILLLLAQAISQTVGNKPTIKQTALQPKVVRINPSIYKVNKRPPIAFKPLEVVDPRTSKPVQPTALLKLENGKTITAAKYYEQMNKL